MEDYHTGEYHIQEIDRQARYNEYCEKWTTVTPYQIGCWVTSYAFRNLFELGSCVGLDGEWLYSDTDSCYAVGWDEKKIAEYNERCKNKLTANGYGPVLHNDREYWLGCAEPDGIYSEFRLIGAKRYCVRDQASGELKITVAGVPKKTGAKCLKDDIENFRDGFIFDGKTTGKKLHTHLFRDEIFIDEHGNEIGDSIDLSDNDYTLSSVRTWSVFDDPLQVEWFDYE